MESKTPRKRRSQSERREATRRAVLETAMQILATEGYAAFASSIVAARAGVSRGALEHYYPRKIDLVAAACSHAIEASIEEARSFAANSTMTGDPVRAFLEASERFFFAPGYAVQIELLTAARADPALAEVIHPIIRNARRRLDDVWTETLVRSVHEGGEARRYVELSHFVMRGLFLAETWLPYDTRRAEVIADWHEMSCRILGVKQEK